MIVGEINEGTIENCTANGIIVSSGYDTGGIIITTTSSAFKGTKNYITLRVPTSKKSTYKKLFSKGGLSNKGKVISL